MSIFVDRRPNHHGPRTTTLTPTEARILAVLADGKPHARGVLMRCLDDDLAGPGALRIHIHRLRQKLADLHDRRIIVCHMTRVNAAVVVTQFQLVDRREYKKPRI